MKTKYLRANNSPFMNKELTKAIMVRSRLKNKSLKLKTTEAREAYKNNETSVYLFWEEYQEKLLWKSWS